LAEAPMSDGGSIDDAVKRTSLHSGDSSSTFWIAPDEFSVRQM